VSAEPATAFDADEWDTLVHALREWGVRYFTGGHIAPGTAGDPSLRDPVLLMCRLAASPDPRLRESLAALFLVHPELASHAREAATRLGPPHRERLIEAYVAAVYLQRLWRTRLRRHLGQQPELPPYWIEELDLPSADDDFGRIGLAHLGERSRRTTGQPLGRVRHSSYELVPAHLFAQFRLDPPAARAA
jgi:hypothetical protein